MAFTLSLIDPPGNTIISTVIKLLSYSVTSLLKQDKKTEVRQTAAVAILILPNIIINLITHEGRRNTTHRSVSCNANPWFIPLLGDMEVVPCDVFRMSIMRNQITVRRSHL